MPKSVVPLVVIEVSVLIVVPFVITYGFGDEITDGVPDSDGVAEGDTDGEGVGDGVGTGVGLGVPITSGFDVVF